MEFPGKDKIMYQAFEAHWNLNVKEQNETRGRMSGSEKFISKKQIYTWRPRMCLGGEERCDRKKKGKALQQ